MFTTAIILATLGLLALGATTAGWFARIKWVAIPNNRLGFLAGWLSALLLGVASLDSPSAGWVSGVMASIAMLGGGLFLLLYSLAKQGVGDAIAVGDSMPVFSGLDEHSQSFDSATLGGSPILLKFFRGHW